MGKRKTAKKPMAKKKAGAMPTTFACLFCNMDNTVHVKLDKKAGIGELVCKHCDQRYQHRITSVSEPYDVWYEWQDAADYVAQEAAAGGVQSRFTSSQAAATPSISTSAKHRREDDDELDDARQDQYEDDGFIERDDEDAEADYGAA